MASPLDLSLLQPFALRTFTALSVLSPSWGGRLVLSLGLDAWGTALAVATNIAGGVSLSVEKDAIRLREVVRSGTVDFVVNTLDEALRAIKNELRKQSPLSVALNADPNRVLEEVLERGLAPQLFSRFGGLGAGELLERASEQFASLDADLVDFESLSGSSAPDSYLALSADELVAPLLTGERWSLVTFRTDSLMQLRDLDAHALASLPNDDRMRRRWLEGLPRILQRQRPPSRSLWLTTEEVGTLEHRGFTRYLG